jgi:hypothetical protein
VAGAELPGHKFSPHQSDLRYGPLGWQVFPLRNRRRGVLIPIPTDQELSSVRQWRTPDAVHWHNPALWTVALQRSLPCDSLILTCERGDGEANSNTNRDPEIPFRPKHRHRLRSLSRWITGATGITRCPPRRRRTLRQLRFISVSRLIRISALTATESDSAIHQDNQCEKLLLVHNLPPPTGMVDCHHPKNQLSERAERQSVAVRNSGSSSHDAGLRMRKLETTAVRISQGKMSCQGAIIINLALLIFPLHALAWNIPGHMLSGGIAYQIVQRERPNDDFSGSLSLREQSLV